MLKAVILVGGDRKGKNHKESIIVYSILIRTAIDDLAKKNWKIYFDDSLVFLIKALDSGRCLWIYPNLCSRSVGFP